MRMQLLFLSAISLLNAGVGGPPIDAQDIFNHNLIVNGGAETGPGNDGSTAPASIPGWTVSGSARVITYSSSYDLLASGIVPSQHRENYFAGGLAAGLSTLTQAVDLSSGSSSIDSGKVTFEVSGYLGGRGDNNAVLQVTFVGATGNQLASVTLGPVKATDKAQPSALYLRRQIGSLPAGARTANVVLQLNPSGSAANDGYADVLELTLSNPGPAGTIIDTNLIANAGAESAAAGTSTQIAGDVPNWVRTAYFSTDSYSDVNGDLYGSTLLPPRAGSNYFWGGINNALSSAYQDIDISAAASLIDAGTAGYSLMAWLGGTSTQGDNTVVTADFKKWDATVLSTVKLGPVSAPDRNNQSGLLQQLLSGSVPSGARIVRITMIMTGTVGPNNDGLADNLSLVLSSSGVPALPVVLPNGVISASDFGGFSSIAPGSWAEIYGANLAAITDEWSTSDFTGISAPIILSGVSVTIGGQPAFIRYTSSGQVNVQAPDVPAGTQQMVLTNPAGSTQSYSVTVNATQPGLLAPASLLVNGHQYVLAQLPDGTLVLPPGTIPGLVTRQAHPGETVTMYGIGFGPVSPNTPAGQIATGQTQLVATVNVQIGTGTAQVNYAGLAPGFVGLYQFNVVVPSVPASDLTPLALTTEGVPLAQGLYIAVSQSQ
jgi:uncharacterized protein (TIGR03437 family)